MAKPKIKEEEDEELEMEMGEKEEDPYSKKGRDKLVEEDEVEPWEEGFMEGADQDGQKAKCVNCGKPLIKEDVVETDIDGELTWFCSEKCLESYEKKRAKKGKK